LLNKVPALGAGIQPWTSANLKPS